MRIRVARADINPRMSVWPCTRKPRSACSAARTTLEGQTRQARSTATTAGSRLQAQAAAAAAAVVATLSSMAR